MTDPISPSREAGAPIADAPDGTPRLAIKPLRLERHETNLYLPNIAGGFSVHDCPNALVLAEQIETAVNGYADALARIRALAEENRRLKWALGELQAMVRGECPSLLNEDSGGNSLLDMEINELLARTALGEKP